MRRKAFDLFRAVVLVGCAVLPGGGTVRADEPPGAADCAACHEEAVREFGASAHGKAMARTSARTFGRSCVACHRPAPAHQEDPSPSNVRRFPDARACVACHGAAAAGLQMTTPAHSRNGVGCLECHSGGHTAGEGPHLLVVPARELCAGCHELEASRLQLPSAHRESGQRPFSCLACHEVHGAGTGARLELAGSGGVCLSCHREKSVPFIFPHPPVEVEGCLGCHEPHGSMNPRLLTRRSVADLCLECHAGISASHDLTQVRYRACQTCHTAVHGSNHDPRLLRE